MLINKKDISFYGGEIIGKVIESSKFSASKNWNKGAIAPFTTSKQFTYGTLTLNLLVSATSEDLLIINKSNLIKNISDSLIKDGEFYLKVTLTSSKESEPYINKLNEKWSGKVDLTFDIDEKYKEQIIEEINRVTSKTINVIGNTETPAIVEIIPTSDLIDIRLEGLADDPTIIKNLVANKKVIIDGELQKVTVDGKNKYSDTDMWDFPRLNPGTNIITVSRNSCDIKIKYKPRYI